MARKGKKGKGCKRSLLSVVALFLAVGLFGILSPSPVKAGEVAEEVHKQVVDFGSSGGLFVTNQKQDKADEANYQGVRVRNFGGIVIVNQRHSDKDVMDVVTKDKKNK